jgi:hypothetical protein
MSDIMVSVDMDITEGENTEWTEDRIVWDLAELEYINKNRSKSG